MTVQQFSILNSQEIPQKQPAIRRFLLISIICFIISFICICTVAIVVLSNNSGEWRQPRVNTSYGDLNSKTSLRSSSLFEILPSTSLTPSLTKDTQSAAILFSTSSAFVLQSSIDSEVAGHSSLVRTMYPTTVTSSLLHMLSSVVLSSSQISVISRSSSFFRISTIDFSSDILSSLDSSILSSSVLNTTSDSLITLPVCPESKFTCRSGECLNPSARCNRYQDCQDKSDEENCQNCVGVQCDSGLCLWSWSPLCNGIVECPDLSDEVNCPSDSKTQCENGVWIYKHQWCNGIDNCYDNSDERNCSCLAGLETECGDGRCIRSDWVCDGYQDCSTDETGCGPGCDRDQYVCEDYSCINQSAVCDGIDDCPQGEEESKCFTLLGDNSDLSGILLGHYKGEYSIYPLCSTNWNDYYSNFVCRSLGHQAATMTLTSGMYNASQYLELSDNQTDTPTSLSNLQASFSCRSNRTVELTCMPKECGKKSSSLLVPFISGGELATRGSWPWVVSVSYLGKPICSGVLISPHWVLTAGHCIAVSGVYNYTNTPHYIQVLLGSVKRSRDLENGALLLRAVKILHHPDMRWTGEGTIYWDIALIKLERSVTFTSLIQPVCLSSTKNVPVTSTCFLTGWGSIEPDHDTTVEYLREAKLRVWDEEECRRNTILSESSVDTNFTLCAGYTVGTLSGCRGDSGSGLMCIDQHRQWSVVGVMSSGAAQCGVPSSQALRFTKVTSTMTWIQQVMSLYS